MFQVASDYCDESLAFGINFVAEIFDSDSGYNLGSKKKSPFTLMRKYVDTPFISLIRQHKENSLYPFFSFIVPSKMGATNANNYTNAVTTSYFEKKYLALSKYDQFLRSLCHKNLPEEIYQAIESLRELIRLLLSREPTVTKKSIYCKFCWRVTQSQNKSSVTDINSIYRHSNKYCKEHSLSGIEYNDNKKVIKQSVNWNNYIKGKRYFKEFMQEVELIDKFSTEKKSLYYPLICLLYTSPSPRDLSTSRMPSSA